MYSVLKKQNNKKPSFKGKALFNYAPQTCICRAARRIAIEEFREEFSYVHCKYNIVLRAYFQTGSYARMRIVCRYGLGLGGCVRILALW